jgi:hypothetical protein
MDTGRDPIADIEWLRSLELIADVKASMTTIKNIVKDKVLYRKRLFRFDCFRKVILISYVFLGSNHLLC